MPIELILTKFPPFVLVGQEDFSRFIEIYSGPNASKNPLVARQCPVCLQLPMPREVGMSLAPFIDPAVDLLEPPGEGPFEVSSDEPSVIVGRVRCPLSRLNAVSIKSGEL